MKRRWKLRVIVAAFVVFVGSTGALAPHEAAAQVKGPKDFEFSGSNQGKVVFSHEGHVVEGKLKCTDCHTKVFKMAVGQRSTFKMVDMEKGQACGACHNGQKVFGVKEQADCVKCHKKKE